MNGSINTGWSKYEYDNIWPLEGENKVISPKTFIVQKYFSFGVEVGRWKEIGQEDLFQRNIKIRVALFKLLSTSCIGCLNVH